VQEWFTFIAAMDLWSEESPFGHLGSQMGEERILHLRTHGRVSVHHKATWALERSVSATEDGVQARHQLRGSKWQVHSGQILLSRWEWLLLLTIKESAAETKLLVLRAEPHSSGEVIRLLLSEGSCCLQYVWALKRTEGEGGPQQPGAPVPMLPSTGVYLLRLSHPQEDSLE
jgi:hypothetical protein